MNITIENPTAEQFAELLKLERERIAAIEESERQRTRAIIDAAQQIAAVLDTMLPVAGRG